MTTLRSSISDTVNNLNKLLIKTTDPNEEKKLRNLRRAYFSLWEEVIKQEIANNTDAFKVALKELKDADIAVEEAKQDLKKVAKAIEKAASAAKAVDKIVQFGIDKLL